MSHMGPGGFGADVGRDVAARQAAQTTPSPVMTSNTGNAPRDAFADLVNQTAQPFQNLSNPNMSVLDRAAGVVGGAMGLVNAPAEFMNNAFARATDGIAAVFPSFPAAVIGAMTVGMPHTHVHPPSLIPPAPPVPLPAIGAVMTGCPKVLIGGVPAVRAGDYGLGPTCGGFTPVFEVFTGSSKVFIGGQRAARMTDFTRQCVPAPPAGRAMGAMAKLLSVGGKVAMGLGLASAVAGAVTAHGAASDAEAAAAEDESVDAQGAAIAAGAEAAGAALAVATMGADLAMTAVATSMGALMGKDPGAPPSIGALMVGVPTVLIGGFPMPSWTDLLKGLGKLAKTLARARRAGRARGRLFCFRCT